MVRAVGPNALEPAAHARASRAAARAACRRAPCNASGARPATSSRTPPPGDRSVGTSGGTVSSHAGSSTSNTYRSRLPWGIPSMPRTVRGSAASRYGSTTRSQMTACAGSSATCSLVTSGTDGSCRCVASTRTSVIASRSGQVALVAGEVPPDRHDLDADEAVPREQLGSCGVPVLRRGLDRVLADLARSHDRHTNRPSGPRREPGPGPLEHLERGLEPVPRDRLAVDDEPAPLVVGDRVEAHALDAEALEVLDARGARREVQHRDERGAGSEPVELPDRSPEDHHDVLPVAGRLLRDPDPGRQRGVVVVRVPHARPDPGLDDDRASELGDRADQPRQEVPPLRLLLVHPGEAERQTRAAVHLDTSARATARSS